MALKTSSTGSYPPIDSEKPRRDLSEAELDVLVRKSIERALKDQMELGIDILVDGQARDDIVSLFCKHIPGFSGNTLPYRVVKPIRPSEQPITLSDYLYARELANGKALKAHITGPMTVAKGSDVGPESGYSGKTDPKLIMDIAEALGMEARSLVDAGAEMVQIDEPMLGDVRDLDMAVQAIKKILEIGKIPFPALHVCGNVGGILHQLLDRAPVRAISMEGNWLRHEELVDINNATLRSSGKQIGLGCISVSDYRVEKTRTVENFIDQMIQRLGEENIWAVTPNCGLRLMPVEKAKMKLQVMVAAARKFG
jgi:5-methyltetrahydropteroyltriglutamate--homocysteine methyltransferase